ncbi:thiamine phosphate synthase [bacterium]|nr:thiamine phosphate synthase [bacterium]
MNTELNPSWTLDCRLWLVLDHEACAPRQAAVACALALSGGVDAVLCRLRNIEDAAMRSIALQARRACQAYGVPFVVSHDSELARLTHADGIQFGVADGELHELAAKAEMAGEGIQWGYSAHSVEEAQAALDAGAAWVFLGPIFSTPEKLQYGAPLGLNAVHEALDSDQPERIVFIGGIDSGNIGELTTLGVRRIAAISALQRNVDPAAAAQQLRRMLG